MLRTPAWAHLPRIVRIPAGDIAGGRARFFEYSTWNGHSIRFFVGRTADGVTRAAFDSCKPCFRDRRAYRQSGEAMICNTCGKAFRSGSIGDVYGGCNPIWLANRWAARPRCDHCGRIESLFLEIILAVEALPLRHTFHSARPC